MSRLYHGSERTRGNEIIKTQQMKISQGDRHWLGDGAYFYKECAYAYRWIHLMCEEVKGKDFQEKDIIENYMILQADINLQKERLFDLDNQEHNFDFNTTREILEKELSKSEKYTHKRITDGTVINIMFKEMGYQEQYDAIQYYFDTDVKGHTNSKIRLREYQLCVKNTEIIHNIREISKEDYEVEKNEKFIIQYDTYKGKGKRYDDKTGKERTYQKFLSKSNTKRTRRNARKKWD